MSVFGIAQEPPKFGIVARVLRHVKVFDSSLRRQSPAHPETFFAAPN